MNRFECLSAYRTLAQHRLLAPLYAFSLAATASLLLISAVIVRREIVHLHLPPLSARNYRMEASWPDPGHGTYEFRARLSRHGGLSVLVAHAPPQARRHILLSLDT